MTAAAKKKAPPKAVRPPANSATTEAGEPIGRWAEVLAETRASGRAIDDYEVTAKLVLHPPTPARSKALTTSQWRYQSGLIAIANAVTKGATKADLERLGKEVEEAEADYNEALYGGPEKVAAVDAHFADRATWEKEVFVDTIRAQFLRLPPDGKCPTCKQVIDAEQVGNGQGSSTTSSTTGMSSKGTSPLSSVSMPATGVEGPDLGPSSSLIS